MADALQTATSTAVIDECDRASRGREHPSARVRTTIAATTPSAKTVVCRTPDQRRECVRIEGAAVCREHEPVGEQRHART